MRMQILIYLCFFDLFSVQSQTKINILELCEPTKLRPSDTDRETKLFLLDGAIDTVSFELFSNQCSSILTKMKDTLQLSRQEDVFLIKCINTYRWLEWDNNKWLTEKSSSLNEIFKLYDSLYWRYLRCKYFVSYWGGNYYEELDIIVGSSPGRSQRFYILL